MKKRKNKFIIIVFAMICIISTGWVWSFEQKSTDDDEWLSLFDGKTLSGWKNFLKVNENEAYVRNGVIVLPTATYGSMTGICWNGDSLPAINYVICYEVRRVAGNDIFGALTFPYGDTSASLIFGGWNGIVNGLSSIDGFDASENETSQIFGWRSNQWYPVHLRVTTESIFATVGDEVIVDIATAGKDIHVRDPVLDTGLTFWTFRSTGEIRNIFIKKL